MRIKVDLKFVLWYICADCKESDSISIDSIDQLQSAIRRKLEFANCEMTT